MPTKRRSIYPNNGYDWNASITRLQAEQDLIKAQLILDYVIEQERVDPERGLTSDQTVDHLVNQFLSNTRRPNR